MGGGGGRPGWGGAAGGGDPRARPMLPGERHDGSWRGSFKAEGSGPSCGAALARPGRSRGFTRSSAGAAFWGRGRLGRVARGWVAGHVRQGFARGRPEAAALRWVLWLGQAVLQAWRLRSREGG